MKNKNYYAVIMAGGIGSRFWPVSTEEYPKQFRDMLGTGRSLLRQTYDRFLPLVPAENILVLTNERYRGLVRQQLPDIPEQNILGEPAMRNTAPCNLYAAMKISAVNKDAVMVVAPSDHYIEQESLFLNGLGACLEKCEKESVLMTLGIKPTAPNTGYGYIQYDVDREEGGFYKVSQFREKPDRETAEQFLKEGNFLWNAGIFIWSAREILSAFEKYCPRMFDLFEQGQDVYNTDAELDFINARYGEAENISIDYAIMEPANNIYVRPADFSWNDLGTWGSLYGELAREQGENVVVNANVHFEDASGNMLYTDSGKKVILGGLHNFIVVDHGDTLLIYPKDKEQEVKTLSKTFKKSGEIQ